MSRRSMIGMNTVARVRAWRLVALAAVAVAASSSLAQAQLVFVNAEDDFGGNPNVNLACAVGGPLSACLDVNPARYR